MTILSLIFSIFARAELVCVVEETDLSHSQTQDTSLFLWLVENVPGLCNISGIV